MENVKRKVNSNLGEQENFEIGFATTMAEKAEIYKFRYEVYIEEMEKYNLNVDYNTKELTDTLDEWAVLVYAKIYGKIISVARINIGTLQQFPEEVKSDLGLNSFQSCYDNDSAKFVFITKLMVLNKYRSSTVLYQVLYKCFEFFSNKNVDFVFGACSFHLIRLYEQMGFYRYKNNFFDQGYGLLSPIVTLTNDIEHFRKIRSPFYRMLRKKTITNQHSVDWFYKKFVHKSTTINSQLVTADELWTILCFKLHGIPTEKMTILQNLNIEEAKIFLHSCASIVNCDPSEVITLQGEISYSYNVLLSGKLQSQTFINPKKVYTQSGEHFGANGLTEHNKHIENIAAITPVEIVILTSLAFARFRNTHFEIAHKIVSNLLNTSTTK